MYKISIVGFTTLNESIIKSNMGRTKLNICDKTVQYLTNLINNISLDNYNNDNLEHDIIMNTNRLMICENNNNSSVNNHNKNFNVDSLLSRKASLISESLLNNNNNINNDNVDLENSTSIINTYSINENITPTSSDQVNNNFFKIESNIFSTNFNNDPLINLINKFNSSI